MITTFHGNTRRAILYISRPRIFLVTMSSIVPSVEAWRCSWVSAGCCCVFARVVLMVLGMGNEWADFMHERPASRKYWKNFTRDDVKMVLVLLAGALDES